MPICEVCWLGENTVWEPESISPDGKILMALKSVQVPEKLNTGEPEACSRCDGLTVAGIYLLNPTKTGFLLDEEDEWSEDLDDGVDSCGYDSQSEE